MPLSQLDPYWQTRDEATVRLYHGDALEVLERLPSSSVHCVVTSPPYWNLRDYQTGTWKGGNPDCDHIWKVGRYDRGSGGPPGRSSIIVNERPPEVRYKDRCGKCGAVRTDSQIGAESHPDLYVSRLVEVFRELRRVLRDDGTFWLDIGDTFGPKGDWKRPGMVGIPHRLAFALQDDGWILAMEHIHSKPAPMTESVTNRCTKSHGYVFMFAKKAGYFFDQFAIREKSRYSEGPGGPARKYHNNSVSPGNSKSFADHQIGGFDTRNKRSVWEVPHGGYKGAHFATFPESLILPCIKAGTSEKGCCTECGAPWKRVVERTRQATRLLPCASRNEVERGQAGENSKTTDVNGERLNGEVTGNRDPERHVTSLRHLGWYPSCKCYGLPPMPTAPVYGKDWSGVQRGKGIGDAVAGRRHARPKDRARGVNVQPDGPYDLVRESVYADWVRQARELCRQAEEEHSDSVEPCVVLDPFIGSGTTAVVCMGLGRYSRGIDLSEEYLKKNAIPRIEGELLGRPALASLVPR
jgi:DNA modification methylase